MVEQVMARLLHHDNRPEAERLARELRERLHTARHTVEDWSEYAGKAEHARLRAEMEKGKERKKWARRAARLNAQAQGYKVGVEVIYSELAMFVPPGISAAPGIPDGGLQT